MRRLVWLIVFAGCNAGGLGGDVVRPDLAGSVGFPPTPDLRATCTDGVQDQDETDVDCGGPTCPACAAGKACNADGDCASGLCVMRVCLDGPSCTDGRKDGKESDVDCGGAACNPCTLGRSCIKDGDCASGVCLAHTCSPRLKLSFAIPTKTPAEAARGGGAIVAGDFDGDKTLDIAVGGYSDGTILALYGKGNGTFVSGTPTDATSSLTMLAAADFDADGRDDVAAAYRGVSRVYLAAPNRAFRAPAVVAASNAEFIGAGDLNGDKKADLVSGTGSTFSAYLGDGKGGFMAPATGTVTHDGSAHSLALGDLNNDGRPDIVTPFDFSVAVSTGVPKNGFWTTVGSIGAAERQGGTATYFSGGIGDFDHDGLADLVVWASWPSLFVSRGDGKGGLLAAVESMDPPGGYGILLVADFDRDGHDDVLLGSRIDGKSVSVWLGADGGLFKPGATLQAPYWVSSVALGDWNGDQKVDIAVAGGMPTQVVVFLNTSK